MTFAYDDWVLLPTKDLYDSDIMKMAIATAKDMYDKGQDKLDKFYKEYGDFMSPFSKDMARYGLMIGGVRNMINDAYAHGVDLLRTPEGRAMISQAINQINPAELNMMRSNAKTGYAYLDALQKLRSEGRYSEAQELFDIAFNHGTQFKDFATAGENGGFNIWDRTSPIKSVSLQEMVHPSFANIKPHLLTKEEAKSRVGADYDPLAEYTGVTKADMEAAMRSALPGLVGTPMYEYYKDIARKELIALGKNPTDAEVNERFVQNAITADSQMMTPLSKSRENYYHDQSLAIQRSNLDINRLKLDIAKKKAEANAKKQEIDAMGWTGRLRINIMLNGKTGLKSSELGGLRGLNLSDRDAYARNYSAFQTKLAPGTADMNTARALFSGLTTPVPMTEFEIIKRKPVSFSAGSGLNFTSHRQYIYGGGKVSPGSASKKLYDYMVKKGITGYVVNDDDISVNSMDYSKDASVWDINGYVRVKRKDLEGFSGDLDSTLKLIGATTGERSIRKKTSKGSLTEGKEEYVDIPVSRTIDSRGFIDSQINDMGDALNYTKTIASKRQGSYEDDDLYDIIN